MRLSTPGGTDALEYRPLQTGDEEALQSFHGKLSARSRALFTPHSYSTETIRRLIHRQKEGRDLILVALNPANEIVAYFFLWHIDRPVALLGIGIADAYQGKGMGRQLMDILIAEGKQLGLDGIELTTCLDNDRAFALYKTMGFRYLHNVDNLDGDGRIVVERAMFMALKEGAQPMTEAHAPPV